MYKKGNYYFQVTGKDADRLDTKKPVPSLVNILSDNPESARYAKKAQSNWDLASACAIFGGGLIGWELGVLIGGDDLNVGVMCTGLALALAGIPFASGFRSNMEKAIDIYNNQSVDTNDVSINLGLQNHGVGFAINF